MPCYAAPRRVPSLGPPPPPPRRDTLQALPAPSTTPDMSVRMRQLLPDIFIVLLTAGYTVMAVAVSPLSKMHQEC